MIEKLHQHDVQTFKDVFSDYLECHGVRLPDLFQEKVLERCFEPGDDFDAVCAVRYGKQIFVVPKNGKAQAGTIIFLDVLHRRFNQFYLK
jgi:hypothetical protein